MRICLAADERGEREFEVWLALGFVEGLEEPPGLVYVVGFETGLGSQWFCS